jgi:hypothetical protein
MEPALTSAILAASTAVSTATSDPFAMPIMTNEQLTAAVLKLCEGMDTLGRDLTEVRTVILGPLPPPQLPPLTSPVL